MRLFTCLLIISLICPPVTAASIAMVCAVPEMDAMPMAHHTMDEDSSDMTHACCVMPEAIQSCDTPATSVTCCDEVQVDNEADLKRTLPVKRSDTSNTFVLMAHFSPEWSVDLTDISHHAESTTFYPDASPPLRTLICTYLI